MYQQPIDTYIDSVQVWSATYLLETCCEAVTQHLLQVGLPFIMGDKHA